MEPVTIVCTVWFTDQQRIEIAQETLLSWYDNLRYDGEIKLHIADDGSTLNWKPEKYWPGPITYSRQERRGVGASLNAGFKKAFETSPYVLYMVDDWRLDQKFDLTPWVHVLEKCEDVGIVRLGPPHPFLRGDVVMATKLWQGWALDLDGYGLCVGHRPEIFHKRFIDKYGWWEENKNACEVERLSTVKWANDPARLKIYLALPHPWFHHHQDVVPSTSEMKPGSEL